MGSDPCAFCGSTELQTVLTHDGHRACCELAKRRQQLEALLRRVRAGRAVTP